MLRICMCEGPLYATVCDYEKKHSTKSVVMHVYVFYCSSGVSLLSLRS